MDIDEIINYLMNDVFDAIWDVDQGTGIIPVLFSYVTHPLAYKAIFILCVVGGVTIALNKAKF